MKRKAFSLVELVIVIAIIGILSAGIISFLDDREKTLIYKAETCMNTINGEIKNYTNAAMTSKMIKIGDEKIFPNYYFIEFNSSNDTIILKYQAENASGTYKKISLSCKEKDTRFTFDTINSLNFSGVKINRGFRQIDPTELFTFSLTPNASEPVFTGEVLFKLCLDDSCSREFVKRKIDTRSQGIFPKRCLFYEENDKNKCRIRED